MQVCGGLNFDSQPSVWKCPGQGYSRRGGRSAVALCKSRTWDPPVGETGPRHEEAATTCPLCVRNC